MNTTKHPPLASNTHYKHWLKHLKQKVVQTQIKAALKVNSSLLQLYWELGEDIVRRQADAKWGDGFLKQLSTDLIAEFPDIKGFFLSDIKYIHQWYLFYTATPQIGQQAVGQLTQIPWGRNLKIVSKCRSIDEALY